MQKLLANHIECHVHFVKKNSAAIEIIIKYYYESTFQILLLKNIETNKSSPFQEDSIFFHSYYLPTLNTHTQYQKFQHKQEINTEMVKVFKPKGLSRVQRVKIQFSNCDNCILPAHFMHWVGHYRTHLHYHCYYHVSSLT